MACRYGFIYLVGGFVLSGDNCTSVLLTAGSVGSEHTFLKQSKLSLPLSPGLNLPNNAAIAPEHGCGDRMGTSLQPEVKRWHSLLGFHDRSSGCKDRFPIMYHKNNYYYTPF